MKEMKIPCILGIIIPLSLLRLSGSYRCRCIIVSLFRGEEAIVIVIVIVIVCHLDLQLTKLWVRFSLVVRCTRSTLCDKVCQWLAAGRRFSPSTPVFPGVGKLNNELSIVNQLVDLHFLLFVNITGNWKNRLAHTRQIIIADWLSLREQLTRFYHKESSSPHPAIVPIEGAVLFELVKWRNNRI